MTTPVQNQPFNLTSPAVMELTGDVEAGRLVGIQLRYFGEITNDIVIDDTQDIDWVEVTEREGNGPGGFVQTVFVGVAEEDGPLEVTVTNNTNAGTGIRAALFELPDEVLAVDQVFNKPYGESTGGSPFTAGPTEELSSAPQFVMAFSSGDGQGGDFSEGAGYTGGVQVANRTYNEWKDVATDDPVSAEIQPTVNQGYVMHIVTFALAGGGGETPSEGDRGVGRGVNRGVGRGVGL